MNVIVKASLLMLILNVGSTFAMYKRGSRAEFEARVKRYALFKQVQQLRLMADEIGKEFAEKYDIHVDSAREGLITLNPYSDQTKNGLFLKLKTFFPTLCTPWGEVRLFGNARGNSLGFLAFCQAFLNKLHIRFLQADEGMCIGGTICHAIPKKLNLLNKLINHEKINFKREIVSVPKSRLYAYRGSDIVFVGDSYCEPVYALCAMEGQALPEPKLLEYDDKVRSYEEVTGEWARMMKKYETELMADSQKN